MSFFLPVGLPTAALPVRLDAPERRVDACTERNASIPRVVRLARKRNWPMDLRVYEALFRFNQAMDQTLESLNIVEKLELVSPESVSKVRTNLSELRSYANNHFASKIAQREQEEASHFYRIRRKREKAEEDPNDIYRDVKAR